MSRMLSKCSSLKKLNLSNFSTIVVTDMSFMFNECSSLKELNIANFDNLYLKNIICMFVGCSDELKNKLRKQGVYIPESI